MNTVLLVLFLLTGSEMTPIARVEHPTIGACTDQANKVLRIDATGIQADYVGVARIVKVDKAA